MTENGEQVVGNGQNKETLSGTGQYVLTNRLTKELSCSLDFNELKKLLDILQQRLNEAANIDVARYKGLVDTQDKERLLRYSYIVRPTVVGASGIELYGTADEVMNSKNFPENIKSVYVNTEIYPKVTFQFHPSNAVELVLDFNKPEVFDFTVQTSAKTPNESKLAVRGIDTSWVNGVFYEVNSYLEEHRPPVRWINRHSVYDVLVWLVGLPIGFWSCAKVSSIASYVDNGFVRAAFYVYVFLFALILFRSVFHYARWIFPPNEYRSAKSKAMQHRIVLGALLLTLVGGMLVGVFKNAIGAFA